MGKDLVCMGLPPNSRVPVSSHCLNVKASSYSMRTVYFLVLPRGSPVHTRLFVVGGHWDHVGGTDDTFSGEDWLFNLWKVSGRVVPWRATGSQEQAELRSCLSQGRKEEGKNRAAHNSVHQ